MASQRLPAAVWHPGGRGAGCGWANGSVESCNAFHARGWSG